MAALPTASVVVFLMTSGDVFDAAQEGAFEAWMRGGGGWVGVHSAADTEYGWPFYGNVLLGTWFKDHPQPQQATLHVDVDSGHPALAGLPADWVRTDEWYNFQSNPRPGSTVLITIDETTYDGGSMGADHPMFWARDVDAGRSFYAAGGHMDTTFDEALYQLMLRNAIEWAGKRR
jgi:type 1 glutamine amidotransferase